MKTNWEYVGEQEQGMGSTKIEPFMMHLSAAMATKQNCFFVLLLQIYTGRIRGDICSGIPAHTPERLWRSSSEIERLINAPLTGLG